MNMYYTIFSYDKNVTLLIIKAIDKHIYNNLYENT